MIIDTTRQLPTDEALLIKSLLPSDFIVHTDLGGYEFECISEKGFKYYGEDAWNRFKFEIRKYFGQRFSEIYHITNTYHIHFIIYLREWQGQININE